MLTPRKIFGGLGNTLFQQAYIYAQFRKGHIPDTYLQSEKYFKEYAQDVREMYRTGIIPSDKVSLHIRLGDYKGNGYYTDLTKTDYCQRAVTEFPDDTFLVFCADRQEGSDDEGDREWCKEFLDTFIKGRYEFGNGEDEIEDFNRMAGCKAHIMANSSFSWWAAYVGGGRTIAPKEWYSDGDTERTELPRRFEVI